MNCYSPSLPQTVLKIQNVQFIIRTNSMFLILELIVSRYVSDKQEYIYMK